MTPAQKKAADAAAKKQAIIDAAANTAPETTAPEAETPAKVITLVNAVDASEVLQAVIAIMKSKVHIHADQMERTLVFRVIGNGNMVSRANGTSVMLYNTNATTPQLINDAMASISVDEFLAYDLDDAKEEAKAILNSCSLSFSVSDLSTVITKNDEVKCKPTYFTNKAGAEAVGLNFVGVQQAEVAKKGNTSALDALLATIRG